jgi:hypothetical protein
MAASALLLCVADGERLAGDSDEKILKGAMVVLLGKAAGIAFEQDVAAGEEKNAVADFGHFDHVVGGPENANARTLGELANGGAYLAGSGGIKGRGGLIEQEETRFIQHRFGESHAGLFAGGKNTALGAAEAEEIELLQNGLNAFGQVRDSIEHAKDAQVLRDGEVTGQWRVDGGEVRAAQRLASTAWTEPYCLQRCEAERIAKARFGICLQCSQGRSGSADSSQPGTAKKVLFSRREGLG